MPKHVLILCYNNLATDPRVQRQIAALQDDFKIEACGTGDTGIPGIPFHSIYKEPPFSLMRKIKRFLQFIFRFYDRYYWDDYKKELAQTLKPKHYDVVIANDIPTLPLALAIAGDKGIVYFDAHEYHPKEFEDSIKWRLLHRPYVSYLCKRYIPKATLFSTVAEGIAKQYETLLGRKPVVITNASMYHALAPSPVDPQHIRLIHHGVALRSRNIELMIEMANSLDQRFFMDFMLVGNDAPYLKYLKENAAPNPRIRFIDPVPSAQICTYTNAYDLGIFLLPPTNFNYLHALPNKLFEFMQARLGIVISPNPEMALFVSTHHLGIVCNDYEPSTMAKQINALSTEQIQAFKIQSGKTAQQESAEANMKRIRSLIDQCLRAS